MKKNHDALIRLVSYSLISAVAGLIGGFLLGYLIYGVGYVFYPHDITRSLYYGAPFLGMSFGTAIGAVLGGVVAIKKTGK